MKRTWLVVADEREAVVYGITGRRVPLGLKLTLENSADGRDRDLESDRPGRSFSNSTGQRHAINGERSTRRTRQEAFARRIATEVDRARRAEHFEQLVLMSGPRMLGLLRQSLSAASRSMVAAEVPKDLVQADEAAIREHVPYGELVRLTPRS